MMTRKEARIELQAMKDTFEEYEPGGSRCQMALNVALSALRPVSREQAGKAWPGCEECHNQDNWPSWIEKGFVYCPKCGTPLASWAWEKQMKRLEALKDGSTTD